MVHLQVRCNGGRIGYKFYVPMRKFQQVYFKLFNNQIESMLLPSAIVNEYYSTAFCICLSKEDSKVTGKAKTRLPDILCEIF